METVRRGDGITVRALLLVEVEIRAGALVELFRDPDYGVCYIMTAPGSQRRPVSRVVELLKRSSCQAHVIDLPVVRQNSRRGV